MARGFGHYPLGDGELQKSVYKVANWSDLHFRNNMLMVCIKEGREERNLEVIAVDH